MTAERLPVTTVCDEGCPREKLGTATPLGDVTFKSLFPNMNVHVKRKRIKELNNKSRINDLQVILTLNLGDRLVTVLKALKKLHDGGRNWQGVMSDILANQCNDFLAALNESDAEPSPAETISMSLGSSRNRIEEATETDAVIQRLSGLSIVQNVEHGALVPCDSRRTQAVGAESHARELQRIADVTQGLSTGSSSKLPVCRDTNRISSRKCEACRGR